MKRLTSTVVAMAALLGGLACGAGPDPDPDRRKRDAGPTEPPTTAPDGRPMVTEFGIGEATAGEVSSGAVERDTGLSLDLRPLDQYCSMAYDADDGVGVVTNDDTLVLAFIIRSPEHRTYGGVGVGSTIDEVVKAFGDNATVLKVRSADGGPLVQIAPTKARTDKSRGIYFRTNAEWVVTEYRVGMWPWVENEEYCFESQEQKAY